MNRRIIAILAAIVLAVTGAFLVLLYARSADNRAIAGQQPTKVYIATKVIPAGTTLKDAQRTGLLVETQAAAMGVPVTTLTNDLHAARRRFRELALVHLRNLVGSDEEFRAEARELFGVEV